MRCDMADNEKHMDTSTIDYYNRNYDTFVESTRDVDFSEIQNTFMDMLPNKAEMLDFGCGSGRDTKCFLDQGYQVEAIDGSVELCRLASEYTGIKVRRMLFQELDVQEKYDGIWACASILHLSRTELFDVLERMSQALKKNGIIYTSFKYGDFEGLRNGRYFTDFTEETFAALISGIPSLSVEKQWITGDARTGRENEKWLNVILKKVNGCSGTDM